MIIFIFAFFRFDGSREASERSGGPLFESFSELESKGILYLFTFANFLFKYKKKALTYSSALLSQ